jgi:hypothetical protein
MADKTRDPEAIEREIERTREDLVRSIDLLAERLSPKQIARRGVAAARVEAGRVAADIGAIARRESNSKRSPLTGPVLISAGLAVTTVAVRLLLRRRGQ